MTLGLLGDLSHEVCWILKRTKSIDRTLNRCQDLGLAARLRTEIYWHWMRCLEIRSGLLAKKQHVNQRSVQLNLLKELLGRCTTIHQNKLHMQ